MVIEGVGKWERPPLGTHTHGAELRVFRKETIALIEWDGAEENTSPGRRDIDAFRNGRWIS